LSGLRARASRSLRICGCGHRCCAAAAAAAATVWHARVHIIGCRLLERVEVIDLGEIDVRTQEEANAATSSHGVVAPGAWPVKEIKQFERMKVIKRDARHTGDLGILLRGGIHCRRGRAGE
jgi:hypothetical protein